jgi:hypothetical protein
MRLSTWNNIKMDLTEIGWGSTDWIHMANIRDQWRALVNTVMYLRVQRTVRIFLSSCATGGFSKRILFDELS